MNWQSQTLLCSDSQDLSSATESVSVDQGNRLQFWQSCPVLHAPGGRIRFQFWRYCSANTNWSRQYDNDGEYLTQPSCILIVELNHCDLFFCTANVPVPKIISTLSTSVQNKMTWGKISNLNKARPCTIWQQLCPLDNTQLN